MKIRPLGAFVRHCPVLKFFRVTFTRLELALIAGGCFFAYTALVAAMEWHL